MTTAHDRAAKESWQLVLFTNNQTGAELLAVTDLDSDYTFEGVDYTSETRLQVELPDNNGILSQQVCKVQLPLADGFVSDISCGLPYYEVRVEIIEVTKADSAAANYDRTFSGLIVEQTRNPASRRGYVELQALPVKSRMGSATLGLPCMHHCINRLGDGTCGVVLNSPPRRVAVTIDSFDGSLMTVLDGVVPGGLDDHYYRKGFVTFRGLSIMIQDWRNESNGNKNEFFLYRRPPDEWIGQQVIVFVGCDKTIETCRAKFSNDEFFTGVGYKMPAYHPNYEDGGTRQ